MKIRGNSVGTTIEPKKVLVKSENLTEEEKAIARENIGAAAIGSGGGSVEGAVLYTQQTLTTEQQAQTRRNIGAAADGAVVKTVNGFKPDANGNVAVSTDAVGSAVLYTAQSLTDMQKEQARKNIGAKLEYTIIEGTGIEEKCIRFAKKFYGTGKAEGFIFFTDPHLAQPPTTNAEKNIFNYLGTLKTYYDATPTSFVICGGDWLKDINPLQTDDDACYKLGYVSSWMRANFDRYYTAIGNHEDNKPFGTDGNGGARGSNVGLPNETLRNLMLPMEKELYYSFDGAQSKCYVLNSSDFSTEGDNIMTNYRWEQIEWLANRLMEDDAENSFIMYHAGLTSYGVPTGSPAGTRVLSYLSNNVIELCAAYNKGTTVTLNNKTYDFSTCTGCMRFILTGHIHKDDVRIVNGIPLITSIHMTHSLDKGDGIDPTFDLCLADYDIGVLRMVRVSKYGNDRDVYLPSKGFEGDLYKVTTKLTGVTATNKSVVVRGSDQYECDLIAPEGCIPSSVVVTMNGVDVTSTVYNDGKISIDSITGNIEIAASTEAAVYSVTTNLTNVTSSNTTTTVMGGTSYTTTLIGTDGKNIDGVTVLMDGVNITSDAYKNGVIVIDNVIGNIEITAKTVTYTNMAVLSSDDFEENQYWECTYNEVRQAPASALVVLTNYIPIEQYDVVRIKGIDRANKANGSYPAIVYYDEDKNFVTEQSMYNEHIGNGSVNGLPESANEDANGVTQHTMVIRGDTNAQFVYNDVCTRAKFIRISGRKVSADAEIIVTVNEEIYPSEQEPEIEPDAKNESIVIIPHTDHDGGGMVYDKYTTRAVAVSDVESGVALPTSTNTVTQPEQTYYAFKVPENKNNVTVTCPDDIQVNIVQVGLGGSGVGVDTGWVDNGITYTFNSTYPNWILKIKKADNSAFAEDYDFSGISFVYGSTAE